MALRTCVWAPLLPELGEGAFLAEQELSEAPVADGSQMVGESALDESVQQADVKRSFQTVMKHTRYSQVDLSAQKDALRKIFGVKLVAAFCAYRPKFERIPVEAHTTTLLRSVASLKPNGQVVCTAWEERPAGKRRLPFDCKDPCIFAFRQREPQHSCRSTPSRACVSLYLAIPESADFETILSSAGNQTTAVVHREPSAALA